MSDQSTKLSYNASLMRVRVEFTKSSTVSSITPPPDILDRAKAKMQSVQASGQINSFIVFEDKFYECWQKLRDDTEAPDSTKIGLNLIDGIPALPWLQVNQSQSEGAIIELTLNADPKTIGAVRPEIFEAAVIGAAEIMHIPGDLNLGQVQSAYHRAATGDKIQGLPITSRPLVDGSDKAYSIVANRARREVIVVIRNMKAMKDKATRDQMFGTINQAIKKMDQACPGYKFKLLKQDFVASFQQALIGPEFLGVDLPITLAAAVGVKQVSAKPAAAKAPKREAIVANYPGAGRLTIQVSEDRLEAIVADFDMNWYGSEDFTVSIEWLENEAKRLGLVSPLPDDLRQVAIESIDQNVSLANLQIGRGEPGEGGKAPYLHPVFKDAESRSKVDLESDDVDLRELQQRNTVKAGQFVAEIRYETEPVPGKDVYGAELPPPPDDELIVRVGDGIQQKEAGKFYALVDGLPALERDAISLSRVLVHQGDVNMRTGNIRFDGPAEIKGSIDAGATVEVTGDLIVHGTIRNAFVKSNGSIAVKSGIVTGDRGLVQARGDIQADFVEASKIVCGGNVTVQKAIISSDIIAGGSVYMTSKEGVIAGGHISCKEFVRTTNLGFRNGAKTQLNVGVDWRVQKAIRIRQLRLDAVNKAQQDDRQNLRELVQKTKAQMTNRHQEMKERLQKRLGQARRIIGRLEEQIEKAESVLSYNMDARIYVSEVLSTNVAIVIAGQKVAVTHEVAGVAVITKRRRGSYIQPIEEIEAEDRENLPNSA